MTATHRTAPISATEKVSDVLARDERLVAVFERHAPHFAKLRNRAVRRVMARLVTVEKAARTANISARQLVNDLNKALGLAGDHSERSTATATSDPDGGSAQRHPLPAPVIEVDVREDLRAGLEPFSRIMSAVRNLCDGGVLHQSTFTSTTSNADQHH